MKRIVGLSRRRCNFKKIWCTKTLLKYMKWLNEIPKSISSWSIAEMGSFLIESMDQGLSRRRKLVEFLIRFYQPFYISRKMASATETSSQKMFSSTKIGMLSSLILASVVKLKAWGELFVALLHIFLQKSSEKSATMLNWPMCGHLEWRSMLC